MKLVDTGYVESITVQYNLLYRDLEEGIAHAKENNVGIVVMGPVAGGRLAGPSDVLTGLVPGIERVRSWRCASCWPTPTPSPSRGGTLQMVEENVVIAADEISLTAADIATIDAHVQRLVEMEKLYCTGCKYCQPCPQDVNIPYIFEMYNLGKVYGLWSTARENYANFPNQKWIGGKQADACIECGICEEKCPQHIEIREQLKAAHAALAR